MGGRGRGRERGGRTDKVDNSCLPLMRPIYYRPLLAFGNWCTSTSSHMTGRPYPRRRWVFFSQISLSSIQKNAQMLICSILTRASFINSMFSLGFPYLIIDCPCVLMIPSIVQWLGVEKLETHNRCIKLFSSCFPGVNIQYGFPKKYRGKWGLPQNKENRNL